MERLQKKREALKYNPADSEGKPQNSREEAVSEIRGKLNDLFPGAHFLEEFESVLKVSRDAGNIPVSKAAENYFNHLIDNDGLDSKTQASEIEEFRKVLEKLKEKNL